MMDKYHVPQYLDEPFRLILWTLDELLALLLPTAVLFFGFNSLLWGLGLGLFCVFGLKKLKGEQGHYFIYNLMYWYLPSLVRFRQTPPSCQREWIG